MKIRIFILFFSLIIFHTSGYSQIINWFTMSSGLSTTAKAVAVSGNDVYVGGLFSSAGGVPANRIAKWDGNSWSALGSGVNGAVHAIAVIGNDVYAAGSFTLAGGVPVNNIAKWDGSSWSALGQGLNELVLCLTVSGSELYAGGFFTQAGGAPANRIAKWNGVSWSPLGSGINNEVNAIAVSGNNVYAGGIFSIAGGNPVSGVARWDGTNWFDVGGGVNGIARAICIVGNDVFVGGVFTMAGGSVPGRIVRWDGFAWHPLGDGVNGSVFSIQKSANDLYVGGMFTTAGNQSANRIAKFNIVNSTWSPIGEGTSGSVDAMAVQGATGSMIICGAFSHVGNNIPANYVARFTDSENPLPVELLSFTAVCDANNVKLNWITASETNNAGFEIQRTSPFPSPYQGESGEAGRGWENIGFVPGFGTSTEPKMYSFTDNNLTNGFFTYRLKQIDFDGTFIYSSEVEVEINTAINFSLEQNYPNPFNSSTKIKYQIPAYLNPSKGGTLMKVTLKVYDILGNEVTTLVNEEQAPGVYEVEFNTESSFRLVRNLTSGIYFYQLKVDSFSETKKLILLK